MWGQTPALLPHILLMVPNTVRCVEEQWLIDSDLPEDSPMPLDMEIDSLSLMGKV